eukprot:TRINITY_DN1112_c0_g1_i3.p3 TRINITY_DN1112_c0_g1~~TRINITY_DN1112_c0_g1_i3.p3  ORF type:complete len:109 (-),score=19.32 TRINITY_DN1112_c0_g1_i3:44-370(-)
MISGLPPFYMDNKEKLFELIKFSSVQFPKSFSVSLKNLLEGLLQKQPNKRLGSRNGINEIKKHPWFAMINWSALLNYEIQAPYIPQFKDEQDISQFATEYLELSLIHI